MVLVALSGRTRIRLRLHSLARIPEHLHTRHTLPLVHGRVDRHDSTVVDQLAATPLGRRCAAVTISPENICWLVLMVMGADRILLLADRDGGASAARLVR